MTSIHQVPSGARFVSFATCLRLSSFLLFWLLLFDLIIQPWPISHPQTAVAILAESDLIKSAVESVCQAATQPILAILEVINTSAQLMPLLDLMVLLGLSLILTRLPAVDLLLFLPILLLAAPIPQPMTTQSPQVGCVIKME